MRFSINIAFLNQNYLIQKETVSALRRIPGARIIVLEICSHPDARAMGQVIDVLKKHACTVLVTVNEWGMDVEGVLSAFCGQNNITHINWCVDDPFFEEIIQIKKFRSDPHRFDFVSDKGYVEPMRSRGYNAFFLPLAADPEWFHPMGGSGETAWENDVIFVGNTYLVQMDDLLKIAPGFVETLIPFIGIVVDRYLESHIEREIKNLRLPGALNYDKALFIARQAAGYFGRKRLIQAVANKYSGFRVFGDDGWKQVLPPQQLGYAKYYTNLCATYQKAKITIDINRMVIRNGFTQRIFDVPASGSFVLTSAKPCVSEFFKTTGSDQEVAVFNSCSDLLEKIGYYLAHEQERLAIAGRGSRAVLDKHTYDHRIREMFSIAGNSAA
jgi:spore maturation protein CgeB